MQRSPPVLVLGCSVPASGHQAAVPSLSSVTHFLVNLNRVSSSCNLWWEENYANVVGVMATRVEALITAIVLVEAGEIVGEPEDTGTTGKIMRRYEGDADLLLITCLLRTSNSHEASSLA